MTATVTGMSLIVFPLMLTLTRLFPLHFGVSDTWQLPSPLSTTVGSVDTQLGQSTEVRVAVTLSPLVVRSHPPQSRAKTEKLAVLLMVSESGSPSATVERTQAFFLQHNVLESVQLFLQLIHPPLQSIIAPYCRTVPVKLIFEFKETTDELIHSVAHLANSSRTR